MVRPRAADGVHDLVVLGARRSELRLAAVVTVGATTSLLYFPALRFEA